MSDVLRTLGDKRLLWPAIAALVGVVLLVWLGNWQMQRLAWKEGLLTAIAKRVHAAPVAIADAEKLAGSGEDVEYMRVAVSGNFANDREIHLYALDESGGPGFHVITPLRLADGSIVLVNRGFVPNDLKEPARRAAGLIGGEASVTGLLRHGDEQGMFIPSNDTARNIWYWRDMNAMATAGAGADAGRVHRFIIDAEAEPAPPGGWPKGGVTRLELPNRHLEYALTWYGLAVALVGVFMAFAISRHRQPPGRGER